MAVAFKPRHIALGIALLLTLAATAWFAREDGQQDGALPAKTSKARPPVASKASAQLPHKEATALLQLDKMQQRVSASAEEQDIFTAKSWYVPPPPPPQPAKPLAPPPPAAPPLPFKFMGQFHEESGQVIVYLVNGDRTYTVSVGDVIDNTYRVEAANARQLVLTYLPLSIQQTLPTGTGS